MDQRSGSAGLDWDWQVKCLVTDLMMLAAFGDFTAETGEEEGLEQEASASGGWEREGWDESAPEDWTGFLTTKEHARCLSAQVVQWTPAEYLALRAQERSWCLTQYSHYKQQMSDKLC